MYTFAGPAPCRDAGDSLPFQQDYTSELLQWLDVAGNVTVRVLIAILITGALSALIEGSIRGKAGCVVCSSR
jgi:hypothetical protein